MSDRKQKLELTWIGKEKRPRLEPRVLIEDTEKSYHANMRHGDKDIFDNMLIHGDNLLALKALEQEYAGKVQCIYIDPPFNTGSAFEHYDDGVEHSIWLGLMRDRLDILHRLLNDTGTIYVHIDNNEQAYLKVIMDEVFHRQNFVQMISVKRASPAGFKVINPGPLTVTDYILIYAKHKEKMLYVPQRIPVGYDNNYDLLILNMEDRPENWKFEKLVDSLYRKYGFPNWKAAKEAWGENWKDVRDNLLGELAIKHADSVVSIRDPHKPTDFLKAKMAESKRTPWKVLVIEREGKNPIYLLNGGSLSFYKNKLREIDGNLVPTELLTDFWSDINFAGIAKEGGVQFKNSKKPEMLIRRVLEMATKPGDLVLDSFLGSGTTAAVAHKMGRRWIGVELGDHCYTHCKVRMDKVVNGEDQGGITKAVGWKGGGGYRFFELAPTLIKEDAYGQKIINPEYDAEKLAEAVCKLEGFTYAPSESEYFIHGYSTERDYIYVTTNYLKAEHLQALNELVGTDRTLLVCCKGFSTGGKFKNLTVKKIPKAVLDRCEYGHDDYSLNVKNLPMAEEEMEQGDLFGGDGND